MQGLQDGARLDVWLDVACLFKTRSEARRACRLGQVRVNHVDAKAHRLLRVGDTLVIERPYGGRQTVVVKAIATRHVSKADARLLFDDQTPPPTPEQVEQRRLERLYRALNTPATKPDRRLRRALRQMKTGGLSDT